MLRWCFMIWNFWGFELGFYNLELCGFELGFCELEIWKTVTLNWTFVS
jgi:hypothetical protein